MPLRRTDPRLNKRHTNGLLYGLAVLIGTLGLSYAAVPMYKAYCRTTGFGGTPVTDAERFTPERMTPLSEQQAKRIRVTFTSQVSDSLQWKFTPQQRQVTVLPGETALAFYTATNLSDEDIIGIATYNVTPDIAAPYFSKVQCFCFDEQKLNAKETVDMPVFFFIDPDVVDDPRMKEVDLITLSYTFFKARYDTNGNVVMPATH
jgi:cytochrome c oxidase assembly protein subunit 11